MLFIYNYLRKRNLFVLIELKSVKVFPQNENQKALSDARSAIISFSKINFLLLSPQGFILLALFVSPLGKGRQG